MPTIRYRPGGSDRHKSEKLDRQIEQLKLRREDLQADEGAAPIDIPKTPPIAPERPQRKPPPDHLPRDTRTHLPESAACLSRKIATSAPVPQRHRLLFVAGEKHNHMPN